MDKHLFLPSCYVSSSQYNAVNSGGKKRKNPDLVPSIHGSNLLDEYALAISQDGLYIHIILTPDSYDLLKSLEQNGPVKVKIASVQTLDTGDIRVTLNKSDRYNLINKINGYISQFTLKGRPKNEALISNITAIRTAALASFWSPEEYKTISDNESRWEEVWLMTEDTELVYEFVTAARKYDIRIKDEQLVFPDTTIKLIKADKHQLEKLISVSPIIGEFRHAPIAVSQYLELTNSEMREYVEELIERCIYKNTATVCVLDAGITAGHPLIQKVMDIEDTYSLFDDKDDKDFNGHGTAVAGLVAYGDLANPLADCKEITVPCKIESVKLIKYNEQHEPELYGEKTKQAAYLPEINKPERDRIYYSTVTADETEPSYKPSSWSGAIDQLCAESKKRLYITSIGNENPLNSGYIYPESNITKQIENPAQAWNAVAVGAYTEKSSIIEKDYQDYSPVGSRGALSPFSSTTYSWPNKEWPIKPDIVMEGGNIAQLNNIKVDIDDLKLLTTNFKHTESLFTTIHGTSAAAALAARYAAVIKTEYPNAWPETVRALLIHSSEWSDNMKNSNKKTDIREMMKIYGYGVPNLSNALYNIKSSLTLIAQRELQPYICENNSEPKLNEMDIYELPWPKDVLESLGDHKVTMRVTLSYFIEPNPREIWSTKYQYQSHGLNFDVNSPTENLENFKRRISLIKDEEGNRIKSDTLSAAKHWRIGIASDRGSVHSDYWDGTASDLAASNYIAVYPITGWWKTLKSRNKYHDKCRYSLVISIYTKAENIDIYTPVKNMIKIPVEIPIENTSKIDN